MEFRAHDGHALAEQTTVIKSSFTPEVRVPGLGLVAAVFNVHAPVMLFGHLFADVAVAGPFAFVVGHVFSLVLVG